MRRAQVVGLVLLLAVLGAACGDGGGTTSEDRPIGTDAGEITPTATATPTESPTATPISTPEAFYYVVKEGDTLGSIAAEFGTSLDAIIAVNTLENPNVLSIGQQVEIPQDVPVVLNSDGTVRPGDRTHIVAGGETLLGIALQSGKTLHELLTANEITAAELIQIGQELTIPAAEEVSAP